MAELFRASEHEPLVGAEWSEEQAEQAIAAIVADAEATKLRARAMSVSFVDLAVR